MIRIVDNSNKDVIPAGFKLPALPIAGDQFEYGSITYTVTKRVFKDNGDLFIYVSPI